MGKKEDLKRELIALLDAFIATGNSRDICDYIAANSNLPGPRGNLELAAAFAELIGQYAPEKDKWLWELCAKMTEVLMAVAVFPSPREALVKSTVFGGAPGRESKIEVRRFR